MPLQLFTDNATTVLAGSISAASLSLTVFAGAGSLFPAITAPQFFVATLVQASNPTVREIVKVTARSTDTFTIVRAQEGTTALTWNAGDTVTLLPTAGGLNGFAQAIDVQQQQGNYALDTGSANAYQVGLTPALTSHVNGMPIRWAAGNTNTGTSTFNDGFASGSLLLPSGFQLGPNAVIGGHVYTSTWNGTYFQLDDPSSPAAAGQFAISMGGATAGVSTAYYRQVGPLTTLFLPTDYFGIGTEDTFTISGLPTNIQPNGWAGASAVLASVPYAFDGGSFVSGVMAQFGASATIEFYKNGSTTGWTIGGNRAAGGIITYATF
jgi:hypothetical protein